MRDPYHPDQDVNGDNDSVDDESDDDSSDDLGIHDADTVGSASLTSGGQGGAGQSRTSVDTSQTGNSTTSKGDVNKQNKKPEERTQRGMMQWKPARNLKFAKDEGKLGLKKLKSKVTGGLEGRQPGVETGKFLAFPLTCFVAGNADTECRNRNVNFHSRKKWTARRPF